MATIFQVLELLEVIQFRSPDTSMKYPQLLSNLKYDAKVSLVALMIFVYFSVYN